MKSGRYNDIVEEHFRHPRNLGAMPDADIVVEAANPICGDHMRLYLRLDGDRVGRATFQTQGCPAAIAASSMTTVLLSGSSRDEARRITNDDVDRALGGLPGSKRHCSVLAEEVIALALDRWKTTE
jgi:nitrogen fixation NifU-like protein